MDDKTLLPLEVEDIAIEQIEGTSAAGTTNCGGTFGTLTCPSTLGTSFCFT